MNTTNFTNISKSKITRQDRAKDDDWIRDFLKQGNYGILATSVDGQPFVHASTYVYNEERHCLYIHSSKNGRRLANITSNPQVVFTVNEMGGLLTSDKASGFGVEFAGVVVFGEAMVLSDREEMQHGLQMLLDKYFPDRKSGIDYRPIQDDELDSVAVYRIQIDEWSGKQKKI
jgi:nitroimidazol reductase NimA-like FMN-containing flavoprotein (pyridoxamine 5'-phosphate oxidase superfamily)